VREIRLLRSRWRGLETESRLGLHGHERGNPGYGQDLNLTDHRASPRPYRGLDLRQPRRLRPPIAPHSALTRRGPTDGRGTSSSGR
jgi:hypothetical protein